MTQWRQCRPMHSAGEEDQEKKEEVRGSIVETIFLLFWRESSFFPACCLFLNKRNPALLSWADAASPSSSCLFNSPWFGRFPVDLCRQMSESFFSCPIHAFRFCLGVIHTQKRACVHRERDKEREIESMQWGESCDAPPQTRKEPLIWLALSVNWLLFVTLSAHPLLSNRQHFCTPRPLYFSQHHHPTNPLFSWAASVNGKPKYFSLRQNWETTHIGLTCFLHPDAGGETVGWPAFPLFMSQPSQNYS